ncbi:MAG: hypothetical protein ACE5IC_07440 [Candidatus Brocadiales bacterium]
MKTYTIRAGLILFLSFFMLALANKTACANISTGWRHFVLGVQEYIADDVFKVEKIEFLENHDLRVKARIRNKSQTEARICLCMAFFDRDRSLLVDVNFTPAFLMSGDVEQVELEIPGGEEVYRRIRYYQISIVEIEEW